MHPHRAAALSLRADHYTQTVPSAGDREADVYDLLCAKRPPGVKVLIRARHNRTAAEDDGERLWALLDGAPVLATRTVDLPARPGQAARTATVHLTARTLTLPPPARRTPEGLVPVRVTAVRVWEPTPPATGAALASVLLTTLPVALTAEGVAQVVGWYQCRWVIEVWPMVLESGCRIESRQLEDVSHLQRAIALYAVIAWRVQHLTMQTRQCRRPKRRRRCARWSGRRCTALSCGRLLGRWPPPPVRRSPDWSPGSAAPATPRLPERRSADRSCGQACRQ